MLDARIALSATGELRRLNDAGVLHAADVHVARRLGALGGETDERVLLAAALCVRGVRQGSVTLRLADVPTTVTADDPEGTAEPMELAWPEPEGWLGAVSASPLVAADDTHPERPLRLWDGALWLTRYWRQEVAVADDLLQRAAEPPDVDAALLRMALQRLWPGEGPDDQRAAAAVCVLSRVAVLAGGPGTGKTTTVGRLLAALRQVSPDRPPRVALAAPTGKAAARLTEAVAAAAAGDPHLSADDRAFLEPLAASTLHRLLGLRRGSTRWRQRDRLPHDVVIVDEASMVSLTLFARLLEQLRPTTRLILVGDPDQLASVEAGAVLADLVAPARDSGRAAGFTERLAAVAPHDAGPGAVADSPAARMRDGVAVLQTVHRFAAGGAIAELAAAVRAGDADAALTLLGAGHDELQFSAVPDGGVMPAGVLATLREDVLATQRAIVAAAEAGDAAGALEALDRHRLLCGHRQGPRGVAHWVRQVQRWVVEELGVTPRADGRYAGLPLLVTSNDYENSLFNGDSGVVVADGEDLVAAFGTGEGHRLVPLGRLGDVVPLHALTVHRSQGSQFGRVTVLLPEAASPLATREMLYTAVTRAMGSVHLVGSPEAVAAAVGRPVARATGLRERLGGECLAT
jgi:exodeoxyribonuclease V alpha subunit